MIIAVLYLGSRASCYLCRCPRLHAHYLDLATVKAKPTFHTLLLADGHFPFQQITVIPHSIESRAVTHKLPLAEKCAVDLIVFVHFAVGSRIEVPRSLIWLAVRVLANKTFHPRTATRHVG